MTSRISSKLSLLQICDRLHSSVKQGPEDHLVQACAKIILHRTCTKAPVEELKKRIQALEDLTATQSPLSETLLKVVEKLRSFLPTPSPTPPATPVTSEPVTAPPVPVPQSVSPPAPPVIKGITNSGNDCFLIALCQFLQTDVLRKYITDQLPDPLWERMAASNLDARALREAVIKHTSFGEQISRMGFDPARDQLDPTEVLGALFNAIDTKLKELVNVPAVAPAAAPTQQPKPLSFTSCVHFIYMLYQRFIHMIYEIYLSIIEEDPEDPWGSTPSVPPQHPAVIYTPIIHPERRDIREKKIPFQQNPLLMEVKKQIERTHSHNINDLKAAGQNIDPVGMLPVSLATKGSLQSFPELFKAYFSPEIIHDPEETIRISHAFITPPDHMLLSFKRFALSAGVAEKISDPIQGISLEFTLPPEALAPQKIRRKNKNVSEPPCYELKSFVSHKGNSTNYGHYISYRKESDGWYYFDDGAPPQLCTEEEVQEAVKQSYLIFYQRKK